MASHVLMRVWSEKADPATVDGAAAVRWTRRSLARLPLDLVTCLALLAALAVA